MKRGPEYSESDLVKVLDNGGDSLAIYFKEMGQTPLLTAEGEAELSAMIKAGNEARNRITQGNGNLSVDEKTELLRIVRIGENAVSDLAKANTRLVVSTAKSYFCRSMSLQDKIQEGNIGLLRAAQRFDSDQGRFTTYATWWIRQCISRAVVREDWRIPQSQFDALKALWRIQEDYKVANGRPITIEELSDLLGKTPKEVEDLLEYAQMVGTGEMSLEQTTSEDDRSLLDVEADDEATDPEAMYAQTELSEAVEKVVSILPAREQFVIRQRYGLTADGTPHTLEEVAAMMVNKKGNPLTRERVRQLQTAAFKRIKHSKEKAAKDLRELLEKNYKEGNHFLNLDW